MLTPDEIERPRDPLHRSRHSVGRARQAFEGRRRGRARLLPHVRGAGRAARGIRRAEGAQEGKGSLPEEHSDGHGHGGDGEAARHVRARPRRLSQPERQGAARRAGDAAAAPEGCAAQPTHAGEVARRSGTSAHRARRRQSVLADVLRPRHRQDAGGLRRAGRAARRIRSCSTGSRPSSSAPAGTSGRCSG